MRTGSRYRPISLRDFAKEMADMGFSEIALAGSMEHVYERAIMQKDGAASRFVVRICSSVHVLEGSTRDCGEDAIRILLIDTALVDQKGRNKIIETWTVYRTQNALTNMRERAREAFRYALNNRCDCGSLMVERKSKRGPFFGCSNYPVCENTRVCEAA